MRTFLTLGLSSVSRPLFGDLGDFDTRGSTQQALDVTVDTELTSSEGTDHNETGASASEEAANTDLVDDATHAGDHALARSSLGLVNLGEESVGRLGDQGSGETREKTGAEVDSGEGARRQLVLGLAHRGNDLLSNNLEDGDCTMGSAWKSEGRTGLRTLGTGVRAADFGVNIEQSK